MKFEPPLHLGSLLLAAACVAAGWAIVRWSFGREAALSRRWDLLLLRGALLASLVVLLFNPVRVAETPGPVQRPDLFFLFDSSQSMALGSPQSRWESAVSMVRDALPLARHDAGNVRLFRFGQRLLASDDRYAVFGPPAASSNSSPEAPARRPNVRLEPVDSDTRLTQALRQISSRFGRTPPAGIVLFSDGRSRDDAELDQVLPQLLKLRTPVHPVPLGSLGHRGDVSIVAAVVPPKARKFSEVEIQVFLRSFGFDGQRTEVILSVPARAGAPARQLASIPITLHDGFQSTVATFRTTAESHRIEISAPAFPGEISEANNRLVSDVSIDRTKIRVLYIEGSNQPLSSGRTENNRLIVRGAHSDFANALSADEDVECVVVAVNGNRLTRLSDQGVESARGFPKTKAELSAFDAIILSDVPASVFTEDELQWIVDWVGQRGAGLMMAGGPRSFQSGGWTDTPLADALPVELLDGPDWNSSEVVAWQPLLTDDAHPVWSFYVDAERARRAVSSIPPFTGATRFRAVKPNLAVTLAASKIDAAAPAPAVRKESGVANTVLQNLFRRLTSSGEEPNEFRIEGGQVAERESTAADAVAALVVGRYGRGRTMSVATAITPPWARDFYSAWGADEQHHAPRFWRSAIYWLTENSSIGRRRLVASADKRFYRPGDVVQLSCAAFNEQARQTKSYRVSAMVEPVSFGDGGPVSDDSPVKWPTDLPRTSGEQGEYLKWGEEFDLPLSSDGEKPGYAAALTLSDVLGARSANQALRVEFTAYEGATQVDSTSLDVQIMHDPFELQNPFPNHELLNRIAADTGGTVLRSASDLAAVMDAVPVSPGESIVSRTPLWSNWIVWTWLVLLVTVEWCWRRRIGLA